MVGVDEQYPGLLKDNFFEKLEKQFLKTISKLFFRFVNFTSNSEDLCTVFKDVEKLFRNPGYVLQQCAYINNLTHFRLAHLYTFEFLDNLEGNNISKNNYLILKFVYFFIYENMIKFFWKFLAIHDGDCYPQPITVMKKMGLT